MQMRKLLTFLTAVALLVSLFSACTGNVTNDDSSEKTDAKTEEGKETAAAETEQSQKAEEMSQEAGPPAYPLTDEVVTFKVATADNYYVPKSYNDNLIIYQKLEELTNVKVDWEAIATDYSTIMATRLAANTDLPDMMTIPGSLSRSEVAQDGLIIDIKDMIAEHAFYLNRLIQMQPIVEKAITELDGGIYAYPGFGEGIITDEDDMRTGVLVPPGANTNLPMSGIRKDWLDTLGLVIPTTADEWYDVLSAFKTKDPNGNGENDEIPITTTWSWSGLYNFSNAFGLYMGGNAGGAIDVDDAGTIYYKYVDPRFKDLLGYLNKLYTNGLIDPEYTTSSFTIAGEKITRNIIGSVPNEWMSNFPTWTSNLQAGGVDGAKWVPVKPVLNPEGVSVTHNRWSIWGTLSISAECADPELALAWLDIHCLSPEGIVLQMYGVEEESHTLENGKPVYTDFVLNNPDGLGPFEAIRSLGGWATHLPYIQTKSAYYGIFSSNQEMLDFSGSFATEDVYPTFPDLLFTNEENEVLGEKQTNINTYRDEMVLKFIEGKESLDKFDEFVAEIGQRGLQEVLEIYQTAYDRFMGN